MNASQLLDEVLGHIRLIKDDKNKLELLLEFIQNQLISDEEDELEEIPPAFEKVIKPIAGAIDAGQVCYLNLDTHETEDLPRELLYEDFDSEIDAGIPKEEWIPFKHTNWESCMKFEPLESNESFRIMGDFAEQLKNKALQIKLIQALNNRKPFADFKRIIDDSGEFRQQWFEFKDNELQKYVRTQIYLHLNYGTGTKSEDHCDDPNTLPF
jgi:hypothetical protein